MKTIHKEILYNDWFNLTDKSGAYYYQFSDALTVYRLDSLRHHEYGAALVFTEENYRHYYLFGKFYGNQTNFTDETWQIFAAKLIKLKVFE